MGHGGLEVRTPIAFSYHYGSTVITVGAAVLRHTDQIGPLDVLDCRKDLSVIDEQEETS